MPTIDPDAERIGKRELLHVIVNVLGVDSREWDAGTHVVRRAFDHENIITLSDFNTLLKGDFETLTVPAYKGYSFPAGADEKRFPPDTVLPHDAKPLPVIWSRLLEAFWSFYHVVHTELRVGPGDKPIDATVYHGDDGEARRARDSLYCYRRVYAQRERKNTINNLVTA